MKTEKFLKYRFAPTTKKQNYVIQGIPANCSDKRINYAAVTAA
jgi:hypothetical protein